MNKQKGFNMVTGEFVNCTAWEVDGVGVAMFGTPEQPTYIYFVKMTIGGEDYLVAESITNDFDFADEIAQTIAMSVARKRYPDSEWWF